MPTIAIALSAALCGCASPNAGTPFNDTQPAGDAPASQPDPADEARYYLPYPAGVTCFVAQGSFGIAGLGSHASEYAIDFLMPENSPILAARAGTVERVRRNCPNVNCPFTPDTCCGNYIRIRHSDGTVGLYYHLVQNGPCVKAGDTVQRGDVIGLSGNTGISLAPHLHFAVLAPADAKGSGRFGESQNNSMEVPFADVAGDGVPVFGVFYTSANETRTDHCAKPQ